LLIEGNELNAAYAADGYARVKGLSALVTTFGNHPAITWSNVLQALENFLQSTELQEPIVNTFQSFTLLDVLPGHFKGRKRSSIILSEMATSTYSNICLVQLVTRKCI
jgi:hypothetical protein